MQYSKCIEIRLGVAIKGCLPAVDLRGFQLSSLCRVMLHMLSLSDQDHGCVQETLEPGCPQWNLIWDLYPSSTETYLCYGTSSNGRTLSGLTKTRCKPWISLFTINSADKLVQTAQSSLDPWLQSNINQYILCFDQASVLCRYFTSSFRNILRPLPGLLELPLSVLFIYLSLPPECKGIPLEQQSCLC